MEPVRLEILLDDKTLKGMLSVEGNLNEMGKYTQGVIAQLESQLKDLQNQFKQAMSAGTNTDAEMAEIQALAGVVEQLKAELKELEAQKKKTNSTPILGDDPAPRLNNLKMNFQQIARELPALAMGPQMFFLAISNNIPMFTDALASARKEYDALTAAGKKATPVWKQVLSSLFSWQTAMAAAITLTVVYGKEIGTAVGKLFNFNKKLSESKKLQKELNEARLEGSKNAQGEITKLSLLYNATQNLNKPLSERKKAVDELQKRYPSYFKNLSDEEILAGNAAGAYERLATQILASARAKAVADRITQKQNDILDKNAKKIKIEEKIEKLRQSTIGNLAGQPQYGAMTGGAVVQGSKDAIEALENEASALSDEIYKLQKESMDLARDVNAADLTFDPLKEKKDTGKSARDYQDELADARIKAQQKLEDARIAVMKEGIEKRRALAKQELEESLAEINKQERDTLKKMEEAEKKRGVKITPEEKNAVKTNAQQQRLVAYQQYAKDLYAVDKEFQDKDLKSWIEYNKEYGTYQQKRAAIMKEYALKSSQEGLNEDDRNLLARQMEEALSSLNLSEIKEKFNWDAVFGNLNLYSSGKLKELRKQLKELIESDKSLSVSDKSELIEQYNKLGDAIIKDQMALGGLFGFKTEQDRQIQLLKEEYELRKSIYEQLVEQQGVLEENYNKSKTNLENFLQSKGLGSDVSSMDVSNILSLFGGSDVEGMQQFQDLFSAFSKSSNELSNVTSQVDKAGTSMNNASDALQGAGNSAASTIGMIDTIIHGINDNIQSANELIQILDLDDTKFGEGFDHFAKSSEYATKAWESLKSGNIMGVAAGVAGSIKELGNAVGSWFGWSADYSDYNEMVDKYNKLNEIWDELIDKKKEYIEMSYGSEAAKVGQEALDIAQRSIETYKQLGKERLNSGSSKGSHSIGVRIRNSMNQEGWDQWDNFARSIGWNPDDIGYRMNGLFDLTTEQLEKLKEEAPLFWIKLDADVQDYLNKIIEGAERIEEIHEQIKEQLTQVSFDSMRDAFYDTLLDMESDSEDFAEDFSAYLQKAILKTNLSDVYDERLQAWYDKFANYNKDGGINTDEYEDLQEEWNKIVEDALAERDALKDIFGWDSSSSSTQSGRAGTITSMTEETAGRLEGIGNAMLDHVINIDNLISSTLEMMATAISRIAENSEYLKHLETIDEGIMDLRRGVKMKG